MRSLLFALLLAAGGCHWLVSHEPGAAPPPAVADLALPAPVDLRRSERPPLLDAARDARRDKPGVVPADLRKVDAKPKPDSTCTPIEGDPIADPNYICPAAICPSEDCDGLPSSRDPDVGCNPLRLTESFTIPDWTSWGRSYCDDDHEEVLCGRLRFKLPFNQTQAIWTKQTVAPTDLVELRFLAPTTPFKLALIVSDKTLSPTSCFGWSVPTVWGCKLEGGAGQHTLSVGTNGTWHATAPFNASGWLVLQLRLQSNARTCRLFAGTSLLGVASDGLPTAPSNGALVMVEVVNPPGPPLTLDLDWVRVCCSSAETSD